MSKYICSACQREYDEDYGFCHECGGRLVEKEKNDPALNLGDANAISGGVSINQSKNISSHDTHYHSTTVERVKSESELKLEATNQLRAKAEEIMAERGRIDSFAMNQLRPLSKQLGIDDETFKSIIKDVRSNRNGVASGLRAADARYLQQAQHAVQTNDMEGLSNLTHRLEAMAAISQDEDVQYLYYLTYALQYPIKSMEVYERQTDENYWRTFWAIVSYIRTGKHAEADNVLPRFDPLRYEKSEEDRNLLEAYNLIMRGDKDGAQEFLDEILGEPTEQVKPLLRAVESTLYEEEPESLEVRFYMERVMSKSDVVVKSQKKTETPPAKELESKQLTEEEAKALYDAVDTNSDPNKINDLKKFAEASDVWAMFYYARLYHLSKDVVKNLLLAVQYYTKAAQEGNTKAMVSLGNCYGRGDGVDKNEVEAVKWFKKAADLGNPVAMTKLGSCYANGWGVNNNFDEAFIWFNKAADLGNADAMYCLSNCYFNGDGITKNDDEGFRWCKKAADLGLAKAMTKLGLYYDGMGTSVEKNENESFNWYKKAADLGEPFSMVLLGNCYRWGKGVNQNISEAVKWYKKAADLGAEMAMNKLGDCYKNGVGVNQNSSEAVIWYTKAADAGHCEAMYNLGSCYMYGDGVNQDYAEAARWYRKAADAGNVDAMCNLGVCYDRGDGVNQDYAEAARWYRKAADAGNAKAMCNLGNCYRLGKGVNQDYAEAAKWYRKAADAGHCEAMYNLGNRYVYGNGVNQDYAEAARWFRKAADAGNVDAMYNLGVCYENGIGVNQDYAEAARWYRKGADAGASNAMLGLGHCYLNGIGVNQSDDSGFAYVCKAAEAGEFTAMANMGWCYEFGRGVEANPVEAMKWYQKALDNGYQMDDWLSQRMEECKLKMPSNVEVIFNTAWTTAPNDKNTYKWNIYLHLHFQINHCNNRKLYVRFTTELSNANNESTGIILSIEDDECIPNYDFCEWKDYIHCINEGAQNWPNNDSNLRLKTTIQVLDEYKNPLTTNSYWIAYNVCHKIRLFHGSELYLA